IVNSIGASLQIYQGATSLGTAPSSAYPGTTTLFNNVINRCAKIIVRNVTTNVIQDSFLAPNGPSGIKRRYDNQTTCSMTFANATYNMVAIYDDNILIGTVGKRGNKRAKTLTVGVGDVITWKDQNNTAINSSLGASYTVACPA